MGYPLRGREGSASCGTRNMPGGTWNWEGAAGGIRHKEQGSVGEGQGFTSSVFKVGCRRCSQNTKMTRGTSVRRQIWSKVKEEAQQDPGA